MRILRLALVALAALSSAGLTQPLPREASLEKEIARLRQQTEGSPKDVGSWHDLASRLREAERWDEAIEAETRALAVHPKYAVAYVGRGVAKMEKREYAAARADFSSAMALWESRGGVEYFVTTERARDEHVDAYRNRGVSFAHEQRFAEAVSDLATALKLRPDDARLLFEKAHLEEKAGRRTDAVADFQRAGLLYADGRAEKAARDCVERLRALSAMDAAAAVEKRLQPKTSGTDLP